MHKAELTTVKGKTYQFSIPENCSEVKYSAKVNFEVALRDVYKFITDSVSADGEVDKELYDNRTYFLYLQSKCISEFYGIPMAEILELDASKLVDASGNLYPHVLERDLQVLSNATTIDFDEADQTLETLFLMLYQCLNSYTFEPKKGDYSFKWKGTKYCVPKLYRNKFAGIDTESVDKISVNESVTALETIRWAESMADENGSIEFTRTLKVLAIIARKQGEPLPKSEAEKERFLLSRLEIFENITAQIALDVFFYLTDTWESLKDLTEMSGFLNHLQQKSPNPSLN